jgi:hypothetical protein
MPIGKLYQPPPVQFTPVLNAGLTWQQLGADDRDAFVSAGEKVKLPAGFRFYKFTQYDMKTAGGVTAWWSPLERYRFDEGLQHRLQSARRTGSDPAEITRVLAAVRTNWNKLTYVLTAVLIKDVYGFWGQAGWQPKFGEQPLAHMRSFDTVLAQLSGRPPQRLGLGGGAGQFFIPNLERNVHVRRGVFMPVTSLLAGSTIF